MPRLIHGVDVSHYQRVDWPSVAAAGVQFAWIKATEGSTLVDDRFAEHWSGAMYAGILRGAYLFATTEDPAVQADLFLRIYPGGGELAPAVDLERGRGGEPGAAIALSIINMLEMELGLAPWIYCSPSYAASRLWQTTEGRELAARCPLWLAAWGRPAAPLAPPPWRSWGAWQTGAGVVDGIAGKVDLDLLRAEVLQPRAPYQP